MISFRLIAAIGVAVLPPELAVWVGYHAMGLVVKFIGGFNGEGGV